MRQREGIHRRRRRALPGALALLLAIAPGCVFQEYRAAPLDGPAVVDAVARERALPATETDTETAPLTLDRALRWLHERGPRLREARARYATAMARADVATPWPNPTIELGPEFGWGSGIGAPRVVPFARLGLTIPLGDRLARQDALHLARAGEHRIEVLALLRESGLQLRALYVAAAAARERIAVRERILAGSEETLRLANLLVQAGEAAALDVSLFTLELARERARLLAAEIESVEARAALAELVGVHVDRLGELPPDAWADRGSGTPLLVGLAELEKTLAAEHPGLLRIRSSYEVAEQELRLEIERQYPDLAIGTSFGGEPGERKQVLGLTLGIELPFFDQNQQAIAEALRRREEIRVRYEAEADRALAALAQSHRVLTLAMARHAVLIEQVLPAARENLEIARRSLTAGSGGALQLLDAERSLWQVEIEVLEAGITEREAWSALERAAGYPLLEPAATATATATATTTATESEGEGKGEDDRPGGEGAER